MSSGVKYWVEAWDAWPKICDTEAEALADGEASRRREIARLRSKINRVRMAPLTVTRSDPDEVPPWDAAADGTA